MMEIEPTDVKDPLARQLVEVVGMTFRSTLDRDGLLLKKIVLDLLPR